MSVRVLRGSCTFPTVQLSVIIGIFLSLTCLYLPVRAGDIETQDVVNESQLMKVGDRAYRRADYEIAESNYRKVLEKNGSNAKAKLKLGLTLFKLHHLLEGYELAYDVARNDPKNGLAYALVGNILLSAGHFKQSEDILRAAVDMDGGQAFAAFGLGMLDFYNNHLEDSLDKLLWAVYHDNNEADYYLSLAQVSARLERYKEAADAYRRFLRVSPPNDYERRDRIKGLISFLEVLSTRTRLYDTEGKEDTVVPIELVNDRPIIHLRIGRSEELRFVIDTGSNITVISQETADKLKIRAVARGGTASGVGGNGKFDIVYGMLPSVSIGEVRLRNVPVYLRKFPTEVSNCDGYIGLSLLSKFLTTIDFENMTFVMAKRGSDESDAQELKLKNENAFVSPLRLTPSGFLSGEVTMPGVDLPLNFIVDTGAELSVISTELAGRDEIKGFKGKQTMRVIGAAGVTEGVPLFQLPSISVGKHSLEGVRAVALNLSVINENAGFEQSGILGGNFLKHYRLTFDFQKYTLSFSPINHISTTAKE
jgi:tetratricopeptide (TPR) repeat protein